MTAKERQNLERKLKALSELARKLRSRRSIIEEIIKLGESKDKDPNKDSGS